MRVIRSASEAEVLACFLRGELASARWRDQLLALLREDGVDRSVVSSPDFNDAEENAYRERLLERHRAWLRRDGLFGGFPAHVEWSLAALTPDEVLAILYIDWDWWLHLSGGTRRPLDAAARIRNGEIAGASVDGNEPIAARLGSADPPPELIAVAQPDLAQLVLLEGHVRLTAYALFPEYLPDELELFLGTSEEMNRWSEF